MKTLRNQSGLVTMEFIFSFVIAGGLAAVLFSISYTLSVVEVTQYVVYSAARAQLGGGKDPSSQKQAAIDKYTQLTSGKSAIALLYNKSKWFEVSKADSLDVRSGPSGDGQTFSDDLAGGSDQKDRNWFQGVSTVFTAKILNFKVPFLGSTNPDQEDNAFRTRLNAMLIREPSQKECRDFYESRRQALSQLSSGQGFYQSSLYIPQEDNGC